MLNFYHIVNPQTNFEIWASEMHRNSLRIAPVSAIPPISSTQIHQTNLSDTWSSTNTGAHSKWSQPVSRLPQQEILPDRSLDIAASASKNLVNDMLTLLKTCRLYVEKHDSKTIKIDRTASKSMISYYKMIGTVLNNESSMQPNEKTSGPSLTA